ncbi:MAG: hypothetical protein HYT93_02860 [Parcubacteria group bacterium]|nr:hypothetical protein [Parcubacteria group bacterium]
MNSRVKKLLDGTRKALGYEDEEGAWDIRNVKDEKIDINLIADIKILDMRNIGNFLNELGKISDEGYFGVTVAIVDPVTGRVLSRTNTQDFPTDEQIVSEQLIYSWSMFVKLKQH